MADFDLRHDPGSTIGAISRCPSCGASELRVVDDGGSANFACPRCHRCWHVELNWVLRVDPTTCSGCPSPIECAQRYAADHATDRQEAPPLAR